MKKLIVLLLCLTLCCGCGAKEDDKKDDETVIDDVVVEKAEESLLTVTIDDYVIVLGKTLLKDILENTKTVIVPDDTTVIRNENNEIGHNTAIDVAVKIPSGKVIYLTVINPTEKDIPAGDCIIQSLCVYGNPKDFSNLQSLNLAKVQFGMTFSEVQSILGDPYIKDDIQGKLNVTYREGDFGYIYFTFSSDSLYAAELHNYDTN